MSASRSTHSPAKAMRIGARRVLPITGIAVATLALGACAVSGSTGSTPSGGSSPSLDINVSLPDISLPSSGGSDSGNSGNSSGGTDSGNNSGNDNSGNNDSGNNNSGGSNSGSTNASNSATNDGLDPLAWAVLIIGAIAVIALIMSGSRSGGDRQAEEATRVRDRQRRLNGVVQNARWASSQASTALTIDDDNQLQSAWSQARSYLPDIESTSAALASTEDDSGLSSATGAMGQAVASLRGAMDNYVNTRATHGKDDAASKTSEQSVRQAISLLDNDVQHVSDLSVAAGAA